MPSVPIETTSVSEKGSMAQNKCPLTQFWQIQTVERPSDLQMCGNALE